MLIRQVSAAAWSRGGRATLGGEAAMPSMKVTVSSAMRARDVSRPQPHHEAAAEEDAAAARPTLPAGPTAPTAPPAPRHRPAPPGNRPAPPGNRPAGATAPKPGDASGAAPGTGAAKP